MTPLLQSNKALSEIVAYVILITIALSLSALVYGWLKTYAGSPEGKECSDTTSLIIKDYNCTHINNDFYLTVTIKNKGLFTADGFLIKVNDRVGANIGLYTLAFPTVNDKYGVKLLPGQEYTQQYSLKSNAFNGIIPTELNQTTFIEIQPFIQQSAGSGDKIFCPSISSQITDC